MMRCSLCGRLWSDANDDIGRKGIWNQPVSEMRVPSQATKIQRTRGESLWPACERQGFEVAWTVWAELFGDSVRNQLSRCSVMPVAFSGPCDFDDVLYVGRVPDIKIPAGNLWRAVRVHADASIALIVVDADRLKCSGRHSDGLPASDRFSH